MATKRLQKELQAITKEPPPFIRVSCAGAVCSQRARRHHRPAPVTRVSQAKPLESDILTWHYVIEGPPDTPYAGGHFHGSVTVACQAHWRCHHSKPRPVCRVVKFPSEYPMKPPGVMMLTPSGRFEPGKRLCLVRYDFIP